MYDPNAQPGPPPNPVPEGGPGWNEGLYHPLHSFYSPWLMFYEPLALAGGLFWIWMLIHCIRHDPERQTWCWILFIFNVPGALVYFFVRWLPDRRVSGRTLGRWAQRRKLPQLEAAVRHIGNAHQYVELGDALREMGKCERADQCYKQALAKDANLLPALWGAAQAQIQLKQFGAARQSLEKILAVDRAYKFGDVSLAYGRTLCAQPDPPAARMHLEQHLKSWTHPEAYVLLAELLQADGERQPAQNYLEIMLLDLSAAPSFFVRQNRGWRRKAKRMLSKLSRAK